MTAHSIQRIAIIGFGEVGGIFGNDLAKQGVEVCVYDILLASRRHRQQMLSKAHTCGVKTADNLKDCLRDAELVISAVTPASDLDVAKAARPILRAGQIFLDINSVSPQTKCKAASHVERSQAYFVEAAVMAGVPKPRLKVPMLLGGPHAVETAERLLLLGMNPTAFSDQIGVASAVKMCRSIMIKGLEALTVECLFAARRFGAECAVLESLAATYPSLGWKDHLPDYLISRVAEHGARRAVEMHEVADALRTVGVKPTMALATAERQERLVSEMATRDLRFEGEQPFSWSSLADAIVPGARRKLPRRSRKKS